MTLSKNESILLSVIEMDTAMPVAAIRKATGFRSHTVRYGIASMERRGIIRPATFIDTYPLGYVTYAVYFSLSPQSKSQKQEILKFLASSASVSWLAELGGDFQYAVALTVRTPAEVSGFLSRLSETFGNVLAQQSVHVRTNFTQLNRRYLAGQPARSLSFGNAVHPPAELDDVDCRILAALGQNRDATEREAQTRLGIPYTTWRNRLARLRERGVVAGDFYQVSARALGLQSFELLVHAKGVRANLSERLLAFAKTHPRIVHFVEGIGEWDFELGVEVENAQDVVAVTEDVLEAFADDLASVKTLPLFGTLKYSLFPFLESDPQEKDPARGKVRSPGTAPTGKG